MQSRTKVCFYARGAHSGGAFYRTSAEMKSKAVRDELRYDSFIHPSLHCEIFKIRDVRLFVGSMGNIARQYCVKAPQAHYCEFPKRTFQDVINGDPCNELSSKDGYGRPLIITTILPDARPRCLAIAIEIR